MRAQKRSGGFSHQTVSRYPRCPSADAAHALRQTAFRRPESLDMTELPAPLLIISPHFDDAVFSCGALLAASPGAVVCTVFAGTPPEALVTDWDKQCGFGDAHEAMQARYKEDDAALASLNATSARLPFLDSQYAASNQSTGDIADAIVQVVQRVKPGTIVMPLGLFHSDHALTSEACLKAWLSDAALPCVAYEDCLYRRMDGLVQGRLAELRERNIVASPLFDTPDETLPPNKRLAVQCYASQLKAFGPNGYDDAYARERYWTLQCA
jgi:LmbE family N-acetylglucosaminyl deacetylase